MLKEIDSRVSLCTLFFERSVYINLLIVVGRKRISAFFFQIEK
jgi:hypothetical protein